MFRESISETLQPLLPTVLEDLIYAYFVDICFVPTPDSDVISNDKRAFNTSPSHNAQILTFLPIGDLCGRGKCTWSILVTNVLEPHDVISAEFETGLMHPSNGNVWRCVNMFHRRDVGSRGENWGQGDIVTVHCQFQDSKFHESAGKYSVQFLINNVVVTETIDKLSMPHCEHYVPFVRLGLHVGCFIYLVTTLN